MLVLCSRPRNKTQRNQVSASREPLAHRHGIALARTRPGRGLPPEGPRRCHFHPLAPTAASASPPPPPPSGGTAIIATWADVRSRGWGTKETSHSEAPARVMAGGEAGDSSGRLTAARPRDPERPPPPGSPTHHRGRRRRRGRTAEPVSIRSRAEDGKRDGRGAAAAAAGAPRPFPQAGPPPFPPPPLPSAGARHFVAARGAGAPLIRRRARSPECLNPGFHRGVSVSSGCKMWNMSGLF